MGTRPKVQPQLVIIDGKDKGKVIEIVQGTSVVGRSRADVTVADPRISRSHVAITFEGKSGKLSFTDLKSLNGTLVNGERVETGELKDGDRLQLGDTIFDCQIVPATSVETPAKAPKVHKINSEKKESAIVMEPFGDDERTADPAAAEGKKTVASQPKTEPTSMGMARGIYLKIPPKLRRTGLSLGIIVIGLFYLLFGKNPGNEIAREVGSIYQLEQAGKGEAALEKAIGLTAQYPNRSESWVNLGSLYSNRNMNAKALEAFEKAHSLQPEQPVLHVKLIRTYLRSNLPKKAQVELEHLEKVIAEKQFSRELFIEAASIFLEFKELKQPPEKTLILARALQKEFAPNEAIGYKLEAQLYFQQSQPADALAALAQARKFSPEDEWILENIVFAKLELKDFQGAEQALDDWLSVHPKASKALLIYAYLKYNEKNFARAMPYVQKILQIAANEPNDPHYP